MEINKAKELITILADGIDPITGEVLPNDHVCNQGDIVRAFYTLLNAVKPSKNGVEPVNAGKPWTADADQELEKLFVSGENIASISKHFQRTRGAIESRLDKLGLTNNRL